MTGAGDPPTDSPDAADAALAPLLARPSRTALFSDFDGTLSPIVDDPAEARPLDDIVDALTRVARRVGRVGVVSGRPASFLLEHLGGRDLELWGLYGLERVTEEDGEERVVGAGDAESWRSAVEEVTERAEREVGDSLGVERKGLALTLHYRRSPEREEMARDWAEEAAEASGLALHPARMSFELRPPVEHGKGTVVEELAEGFDAVCFLGDDRGDLSAFDALDRLAARGVHTVRVAVRSEEAPDELLERADLVVDGPSGVLELLESLASSTIGKADNSGGDDNRDNGDNRDDGDNRGEGTGA